MLVTGTKNMDAGTSIVRKISRRVFDFNANLSIRLGNNVKAVLSVKGFCIILTSWMAAWSYSIILIVFALIVYNFVAGRQRYRQHKYRKTKAKAIK